MEKATFGAGCFWGVEAAFRRIKGVKSTAVGYAGGWKEDPTYQDVCTDGTGHADNFARVTVPEGTQRGAVVAVTPRSLHQGLLQ